VIYISRTISTLWARASSAPAANRLLQARASFNIPGRQIDAWMSRRCTAAGREAIDWCRAGRGRSSSR